MTYRHALMTWLGAAGLVATMTGCPAGDDGETGAETTPTPTTTDAPTTDAMTTTGVDSTTDAPVTCDPPCEPGQECIGGQCFDMPGEPTTGDPPPMGADYGSCDMCAAGEMPVAIMGLDGFCFCSPVCDGMSCPDPNEGDAMPVCALGFEMGQPPTQCVLVCTTAEDCPTGASCENVGMASICTYPVPM